MRILDFIVSGQKIERDPRCDFSDIATGSRGYLHARFRFSADWKGCKVVAVFSCRGKEYMVPMETNVCAIPYKALVGNTVGVYLVGQHDDYRITTNRVRFEQGKGA